MSIDVCVGTNGRAYGESVCVLICLLDAQAGVSVVVVDVELPVVYTEMLTELDTAVLQSSLRIADRSLRALSSLVGL